MPHLSELMPDAACRSRRHPTVLDALCGLAALCIWEGFILVHRVREYMDAVNSTRLVFGAN
jgi:hypothetical protein